jgi:hypothetical protein
MYVAVRFGNARFNLWRLNQLKRIAIQHRKQGRQDERGHTRTLRMGFANVFFLLFVGVAKRNIIFPFGNHNRKEDEQKSCRFARLRLKMSILSNCMSPPAAPLLPFAAGLAAAA